MKRLPLSHPQRRIWFAETEYPDSAVNGLVFLQKCPEETTPTQLETAWRHLVERSEALRLRIHETPAEGETLPVSQSIDPKASAPFEILSFSNLETAKAFLLDFANTPHPLYEAPLARFWAVKVEEDGSLHYGLFVHHIVADGRSLHLLAQWITDLLQGGTCPENAYLPFIAHETAYLSSEQGQTDRDYWLEQARNFEGGLSLGTGTNEHEASHFQFQRRFDAETWSEWKRFARSCRATPYRVLAAALAIYGARVNRLDTVALGIAHHNRDDRQFFEVVGMFVSTLPLIIKYDPKETFRDLLGRLNGELRSMLKKHSRFPFNTLAELARQELGVDLSKATQVNLVGHPDLTRDLGETGMFQPGTTPQGLTIHFNIEGDSQERPISLTFTGDGATVRPSDAERLFVGLEALIASVIESPECPVGELPLIPPSHWQQLLAFNGEFVPYPEDQSILDRLAVNRNQEPDKTILLAGERELTWSQLDAWSSRIAQTLLQQSGDASLNGQYVGLSLRRDIALVPGILGILKTGAAYVPLDPAYPQDRLNFLCDDANVQLIVAHSEFSSLFEGRSCLDPDPLEGTESTNTTLPAVGATQVAYAIYTSGTTGKPKGVPIQHHQVCHLAQALEKPFQIHREARCLSFASTNFDASVAEILVPLMQGATLVVAGETEREDGEKLIACLDRHRISCATIPPALLAIMPREPLPHLTTLIVAGESTDPGVIAVWSKARRMVNGYGPTENTVASSVGEFVTPGASNDIGPPLPNVHAYVLDSGGQPLPLGVAGELFVAGPGVSEGYLNRPELTAERFLPNPWGTEAQRNTRLYKTGDLVRWTEQGHLEFLGRIDFQVKIRGHRIECGEVTAAIASLDGVRSSTVVPLPSGSTHKLIAYVILDDREASPLTPVELKGEAARRLPDYMVPAHFLILEAFPMTPNGKIDLRALPKPEAGAESRANPYIAPSRPEEETLCRIMAEILKIERVGIDDDFFELGGDSLSCMELVAAAKDAGIGLDVAMVKRHPTVRGMAELAPTGEANTDPALKRDDSQGPFPLGRNALMMVRQSEQMAKFDPNIEHGTARWDLPDDIDVDRLLNALDATRRRHDALSTRLEKDTLHPVDPLLPLVCEPVTEAALPDILQAWATDFGTERPTCDVRLFRMEDPQGGHALVMRYFHEILDAWSNNLFQKEVLERYAHPDREIAHAYQLRDFTSWYHALLETPKLQDSRDYWKGITAPGPVFSQPPEPADASTPYLTLQASQPLDVEIVRAFEARCLALKATLFEGAYTLYHLVLAEWSEQSDILTGYVTALRETKASQGIIGGLTNRLCLRTQFAVDRSFEEALEQTQTALRENSRHTRWPVWQDMDPEGTGFPHLFFHYVPYSEPIEDAPSLPVRRYPPKSPASWPLGLAFQFVDHPSQPSLFALGRAGYVSPSTFASLQEAYSKRLVWASS